MTKRFAGVKIWEEDVVIPTYEVGEPDKNPIFSEKRVYQGSSGKVYPYPVIEKIKDEKIDKTYHAVYLENQYLKIMILPQLGGRIQRALDKTNDYDFVYYNHVIKPALVGLTGPWISGGIEFNWPQHHRPTTYSPVDYTLAEHEDGSKTVFVHDVDQMYGTKGIAGFTLYPDQAYLEVAGQLYNRTAFPQTFLWWANPAVAVNDFTQSIFPPDVHAVMDHGKRDVSRFPIATGVYYKKDYSEGVDISRYKNIPVPTSFMAEKSEYDFIGGYDHHLRAGILHVADHHLSPGKKQWTWGCGDFGRAWDRNLTDEDGPYIELMTGVYTDNQPDFTWLKPFEEKSFKQYFMPYKDVGEVKNATIHGAVNLVCDGHKVSFCVYTTGSYPKAKIVLKNKAEVCLATEVDLSPVNTYQHEMLVAFEQETDLLLQVISHLGVVLVEYRPLAQTIIKYPEPAVAAKEPVELFTNEELYLTGLHIEQYRHATYEPDDYYLEGLKRDPADIRINNAYGRLLLLRGLFSESEHYFRKAIERLTWKNPNPYDSEPYYNLGLSLLYQGKSELAYDSFFKATWTNEQQEMSFYYLAVIKAKEHDHQNALAMCQKSLVKNSHNIKARGIKTILLRKLGFSERAKQWIDQSLDIDPFDYLSRFEQYFITSDEQQLEDLNKLMRGFYQNYLQTARDYAEVGCYQEAVTVLNCCRQSQPLINYYQGYYLAQMGREKESHLAFEQAAAASPVYCFPNKLEDIAVLEYAIGHHPTDAKAPYYLGTLYYDKKQYITAKDLWEKSIQLDQSYATVYRNLAMVYYNKCQMPEAAKVALEQAFKLDSTDARVMLELDQLYKKLGYSAIKRRQFCEKNWDTLITRDDLFIEYITILNQLGLYHQAYQHMSKRNFHPWEGGEGKITTQYKTALIEMGKQKQQQKEDLEAAKLFEQALSYPENLGEGKLEGTKDNHIYYYLGLCSEMLGQSEKAQAYYQQASIGLKEVAGMMYYYDQPADMILYQGLAHLKLDDSAAANTCFYQLIEYGEKHLYDEIKIEYFAVSLPDFLIFNEDWNRRHQVHCYYVMALGQLGLGNAEKANKYFDQALELDQNHLNCILYRS